MQRGPISFARLHELTDAYEEQILSSRIIFQLQSSAHVCPNTPDRDRVVRIDAKIPLLRKRERHGTIPLAGGAKDNGRSS
jgi:hypothetical protein